MEEASGPCAHSSNILPPCILSALFCTLQVLGKKDIELGVRDTLSTSQFAAAWTSLGVSISPGYVDAVFNKYGQTSRGMLPVMVGLLVACCAQSLSLPCWNRER